MKKIKNTLISLKNTMDRSISPRTQKIIGAAATVPIIAVSTMSGVCAASCPYGVVYCPYPGQCFRYTDPNGDGNCDLSLSAVNAQTSSAGSGNQPTTHDTSATPSHASSSGGANIQNGSADHSNASATTIHDPSSGLGSSSPPTNGNDFHIIPVSLLIIGAYFFTHYLFNKGILKPKTHKRLWNLLLMGGYLGTSVTGLLLIFIVNLGISLAYRQGITFLHVELALLMVIGTMIHFHIYRKPLKNMFQVLSNFKSGESHKRSNETPGTSK